MNICTIIAKNYVAHARVLAESFNEHHPDGTCFALIIDGFDTADIDPAKEPFTILRPEDLDLSRADFDDMRSMYTVLEFSTAVKPWLLRHMLAEHDDGSGIAYFDPDIRIFSRMEELEAALRESAIVLTPHLTKPMPRDGMKPSETDIMIAGIFNLGFIGLAAGDDSSALLAWWQERLRTDCWVAPERGLFVDQKWIDWVPGLLTDVAILREPTYNIAYWNLPTRDLDKDASGYTVDGLPLRFYHFSGYSPDHPTHLSKHQDRVALVPGSVLAELCDGYGERLLANDYERVRTFTYDHDVLPSGERLDAFARELYRRGMADGLITGSIFTPQGELDLVAWMNQADHGTPGLTRYLHELWLRRPDLQQAYPEVTGADLEGYLGWCEAYGRDQVPIASRMLRTPAAATPPPTAEPGPAPAAPAPVQLAPVASSVASPLPFGVNVAGYLRSELGIGEVARQMIRAMDAASVASLPRVLVAPGSRQGHSFASGGERMFPYALNLVFVNADGLPAFAEEATEAFFRDRYTIGYWWWELPEFPEKFHGAFDLVDEVWVGSSFVAESIGRHASVPVVTMPVPIDLAIPPPLAAGEYGWPADAFTFHFSWDYNSVFRRKNPLGLVEAYMRAFGPDEGASLVLKCINGHRSRVAHAELQLAIKDRPDIVLIDDYIPARDKNRLIATCDCYISLHRSEGLGLTMAEAMLMGKPVIATNYSGNTDFMSAENSYPVDFTMVAVGEGSAPYPEDSEWAEPDLDHAVRLMREVFEDREGAAVKAALGAKTITDRYSPAAVGQAIAKRLQRVSSEAPATRVATIDAPEHPSDQLEGLVARGTLPRAPSRFGKGGAALRKGVLRAIKPYSAYQGDVNAGVLRRIDQTQARADATAVESRRQLLELEHAQTQDLASLLSELRRQRSTIEQLTESVARESLTRTRETEDLRREVKRGARLAADLDALPYMSSNALGTFSDEEAGEVFGYREAPPATAGDDEYRAFEELFRGSEAFIHDRQRRYLPLMQGPVLDVGCGRGEMLDLLEEAGVEAVGLDSDEGMVARCHAKGHTSAVLSDALEYLEGVPDGSLGTIFSAQVVEHLPPAELRGLIATARRKLRPGGRFIAETVNPHSVSALKTFWVDVTHQHPLFPEVMVAFARIAGFPQAYVFHPNGTGDVDRDRSTTGEYALVATA